MAFRLWVFFTRVGLLNEFRSKSLNTVRPIFSYRLDPTKLAPEPLISQLRREHTILLIHSLVQVQSAMQLLCLWASHLYVEDPVCYIDERSSRAGAVSRLLPIPEASHHPA